MPTVLIIGAYRFYFFSNDRKEPAHIHVERDNCTAKFWLEEVTLVKNHEFSATELAKIRTLVEENRSLFLNK